LFGGCFFGSMEELEGIAGENGRGHGQLLILGDNRRVVGHFYFFGMVQVW
jgi:hypothetical protein